MQRHEIRNWKIYIDTANKSQVKDIYTAVWMYRPDIMRFLIRLVFLYIQDYIQRQHDEKTKRIENLLISGIDNHLAM